MLKLLHTVNKSPTEKPSLLSCLRLAQPSSDILLIEDGVYAAMTGTAFAAAIHEALEKQRVFVLEPDLLCRGLSVANLIPGVKPIDYEGFVDLAVSNDSVHSWL